MPPVDSPEDIIINRFNAIFNHDEVVAGHHCQPVEQFTVDAVRPCSDHQPCHGGVIQSFIIKSSKFVNVCISVGICLEISNISLCAAISAAMEGNSLLNLISHTLFRRAVAGNEGLVVAVCAASVPQCAVTVRAGEAGVDAQFLDSPSEQSGEPVGMAYELYLLAVPHT